MTHAARPKPEELQDSNRRVVKAIVVQIPERELPADLRAQVAARAAGGESKALPTDDMLETLQIQGRILEPPFDQLVLAMLPEHSTELGPAVAAMETNIDGFGHRLECRVNLDDPTVPEELRAEVRAEHVRLMNWFANCTEPEETLRTLRKKTRRDLETTGNAYWEVIRNPLTNAIEELKHIPSYQVRLGAQDLGFTEYARVVAELQLDGSVRLASRKATKRFRAFVQSRIGGLSRGLTGYQVRWFKEFLDPRVIDNETGEIVPQDRVGEIPEARRANEIFHWKIYSPRSPYGLPRFIGHLLAIFGDRASDELNFVTLKNNNIPSMMLLVSNGQLTQGSIDRIQEFVDSQVEGSANMSRFLIVEAEGAFEGEDGNRVKVDVKPLVDQQMRDQMFTEYQKANSGKIRKAFRLPPIFVGSTDDYNKATAEESRKVADEQVFMPERVDFDDLFNKNFMTELGAQFYRFKSMGPNVTDDQDLLAVLNTAERTGGLTPRIAREIIGDIIGRELPEIDPATGVNPDVPFSLQMAEAVKNLGLPNEPGQQVTALKAVIDGFREAILKSIAPGARASADMLVEALVFNRDALEELVLKKLSGEAT
jgi:capsid portal protein